MVTVPPVTGAVVTLGVVCVGCGEGLVVGGRVVGGCVGGALVRGGAVVADVVRTGLDGVVAYVFVPGTVVGAPVIVMVVGAALTVVGEICAGRGAVARRSWWWVG